MSPHLGSALNLARWLVRSREDAEDIVQEAFLRAFASFEDLRGSDAKPWLLAIVRNACMTWLRRNRPESVPLEPDRFEHTGAGPEAQLLRAADRDEVRKAVADVPAEFREAIVLREFEGLSYKEIAAVTNVPVGTVMSRLSRGREWLRNRLSGLRKEAAL